MKVGVNDIEGDKKRSQNFEAIAELQGDRRTSRRSQDFKGIESEIVGEEKNFCERNQKILSIMNQQFSF